MTSLRRALLPALPRPPLREMIRSGVGAGLGLLLADLILWAMTGGKSAMMTEPLLIAPFGASAFLIFAVPNSPLAQPWSAVMGNTLSALAALLVARLGLPMLPGVCLAVLLAVVAMGAARAMHPPGGAVAIATMLVGQHGPMPDFSFALQPVFAGTAALAALGVLWNHATGRQYPFRQPTTAPAQRQTPGPFALAAALNRLRMGPILGVEDLSRLIAAAEATSAVQSMGPMTAAQIMSRDLIYATPNSDTADLIDLFRKHEFRHLPLVGADGAYLGLIPQTVLLGPDAAPTPDDSARTLPPTAPLTEVLALMAEGRHTCIPVTEGARLVGLITRSDLLAALTHHLSHHTDP